MNKLQADFLISHLETPDNGVKLQTIDEEFQSLFLKCDHLYNALLEKKTNIRLLNNPVNLPHLFSHLIAKQEQVIKTLAHEEYKELLSDTSEDEDYLLSHEESKKNFYTPSGMSALFAPMVALYHLQKNETNLPLAYSCGKYCYFEITASWNKSLKREHFIRADDIANREKGLAYKNLLESDCLITDNNKLLKVEKKELYSKTFSSLINAIYKAKSEGKDINSIFANIQPLLPDLNSVDIEKLAKHATSIDPNQILFKTIYFSLSQNLNLLVPQLEDKPDVYFIDNNPCVNTKDKPTHPLEILQQLLAKTHYPKIVILDTTSATLEQIKTFVERFDTQDKIPLLVTASSQLKHHEFGLDLWQLGENKVFLSKACVNNTEHKQLAEKFFKKLKALTKSTEPTLSRVCRRTLRESLNSSHGFFKKIEGKTKKPHQKILGKKVITLTGFSQHSIF